MAYGSSYGMAGVNKGFLEQMMKQNQEEKEAGAATTEQKKEMQAKFQAELEAAQARARKKSKKFGGLGKLLDIAGMFMGPLGAGLTGGINALIQGTQAKKGAESLMGGVNSKRWGNTFMSEGMDEYKKEVDDSQMSMGDMLGGALMSGIGSFAMSKAGGAEKGGAFKDMFKPGEDMVEGATNASFGEGSKAASDFSSKAGGIDNSLEMFGEKSANFDAFGKNKLGGMPSQTFTAGKATPLKNLLGGAKDSFKQMTGDFAEDGLKGMDYQEMMKVMNMMQKIGGQ